MRPSAPQTPQVSQAPKLLRAPKLLQAPLRFRCPPAWPGAPLWCASETPRRALAAACGLALAADWRRTVHHRGARRLSHAAVGADGGPGYLSDEASGAPAAEPQTSYVKVLVGKVHWVDECGAVVTLEHVYDPKGSDLPRQFLALLDADQAAAFQRAMFGSVLEAAAGDDAICDVRVHDAPSGGEPFGELVMRRECPVFPALGDGKALLLSDVIDAHQRRHRCAVGEALATAQCLAVPALVSTSYIFRAAKNCMDREFLEKALCSGEDEEGRDEACDIELRDLSERLAAWIAERDRAATVDTHAMRGLLADLDAFAWFWALHSRGPFSGQSFGEFRKRYQRFSATGGQGSVDN